MAKGKIKVGDVGGNVIISTGQKGGTITQPSEPNISKKSSIIKFILILISVLASVATVLDYFDLYPFKEKGENTHFPHTVIKDSVPLDSNQQTFNQVNRPIYMKKIKEKPSIEVGDVTGNVIISQNQSGGITAHTVNISKPLPRELSKEDKEKFQSLEKDYLISIVIVGGLESQKYGREIANFFKSEGYTADVIEVGMYSPEPQPARYHLKENPESKTIEILIPKSDSF